MLQSISWKEYLTVVGAATGIYYGWWLFRYYNSLRWSKAGQTIVSGSVGPSRAGEESVGPVAGRAAGAAKTAGAAKDAGTARAPGVAEATEVTTEVKVAQELDPALPAVITKQVYLPAIAANLAVELIKLLNQCGEELMSEKELTNRLQQLLGNAPYDKLKGSVFQEKIDALIGRELEKYGSIRFDPEVIRGLWQG